MVVTRSSLPPGLPTGRGTWRADRGGVGGFQPRGDGGRGDDQRMKRRPQTLPLLADNSSGEWRTTLREKCFGASERLQLPTVKRNRSMLKTRLQGGIPARKKAQFEGSEGKGAACGRRAAEEQLMRIISTVVRSRRRRSEQQHPAEQLNELLDEQVVDRLRWSRMDSSPD